MCSASQEIRVTRFAQPTINPLACCICWAGLLGRAVFPPWKEGPNFGSYNMSHFLRLSLSHTYTHTQRRYGNLYILYIFLVLFLCRTLTDTLSTSPLRSFQFFKNFFLYLWLIWVFTILGKLSLVAVSGGFFQVAVCRLLIAVDYHVAEHRLWSMQALVVGVYRLSCCKAYGIFHVDQGSNLCLLHWPLDS